MYIYVRHASHEFDMIMATAMFNISTCFFSYYCTLGVIQIRSVYSLLLGELRIGGFCCGFLRGWFCGPLRALVTLIDVVFDVGVE